VAQRLDSGRWRLLGDQRREDSSDSKAARPLGVVLFVYEARPTVSVEGALLSVATGNAVLLRGGREISQTNRVLGVLISAPLRTAGLPAGLVRILDDPDRAFLRALLRRRGGVDLVVPRGGPSLISYCQSASAAPVLASGGGVNHLYVHHSADLELAADIALDSKLAQPTACNNAEMVIVDSSVAAKFVTALTRRRGVEFTIKVPDSMAAPGTEWVHVEPLAEHDLGREFLDRTLAVWPVPGLEEALAHVREYGSGHTEGVVATDTAVTEAFTLGVDAAAVVVNGSLRLHDGPTMGLGPEISISTGKLHARGPVTTTALRTYTWLIDGRGAVRRGRCGDRGTGPRGGVRDG
jgi:glutamate-5-semialdehyde dehydrogenase